MFWKRHPKKILRPEERERILEAIRRAEEQSSGEIRVHLDCCSGKDVLAKAKEVFLRLGMTRTRQRNGVLIYLATSERKFAILGDEGINRLVPENYWEEVTRGMEKFFREGRIGEGLLAGIHEVGEKLSRHFPPEKGDVDELPNEISQEG